MSDLIGTRNRLDAALTEGDVIPFRKRNPTQQEKVDSVAAKLRRMFPGLEVDPYYDDDSLRMMVTGEGPRFEISINHPSLSLFFMIFPKENFIEMGINGYKTSIIAGSWTIDKFLAENPKDLMAHFEKVNTMEWIRMNDPHGDRW
jgi:hypothetical protein